MSNWTYTDEELRKYFDDPATRRGGNGHGGRPPTPRRPAPRHGVRAWMDRTFGDDPRKRQAAGALLALLGVLAGGTLVLFLVLLFSAGSLPSLQQLENPDLQLATVAYTADGEELARYARQNRTWVPLEQISPHVLDALLSTEDERFRAHWGVDPQGIVAAAFEMVTGDGLRGASTISQQLARNLYNEQIGRDVTLTRKLKEMVTAVRLERRYTKDEIAEMYLNTVEFVYNAFGIEAAARTFFNKPAGQLDALESATLVGMLQNPALYNPVRFPERSQRRRNVVLAQMVKHGHLTPASYEAGKDEPVRTDFNSSEITASRAPYFAEYVRNWTRDWARANGVDLYADGLVIYTTLDSRLQEVAQAAVDRQMEGLQAVVDYEWSRPSGYVLGQTTEVYVKKTGYEPFAYLWESKTDLVNSFIRESEAYRGLREEGVGEAEALQRLRGDAEFMKALKADKTRLEAGLVALDPRTGHVKAWVGGRDLKTDWYDHVAIAKRQPGSTFKPFVYTAAIDNGYSPSHTFVDVPMTLRDEYGTPWRPGNFGGSSGASLTLTQALAKSVNTVTAQLAAEIGAKNIAFYARRMGIKSPLEEVLSLSLGTSDVTLLEMTGAYATLANGGLRQEPTVVTRIEDRFGNVLYEATPAPEEALSEETAYTVVDMMRGAVDFGTSARIRTQFGLGDYDLAAKTGTTQNAADVWFMMMHPDLVMGAWVGFNDRRLTFRSTYWGQGGHTALYLVGDFFRAATKLPDTPIDKSERFPDAAQFRLPKETPMSATPDPKPTEQPRDERRIGW